VEPSLERGMTYSREESVKKRRARKQTGIALPIYYPLGKVADRIENNFFAG
jgi:hypothetical protein